MKKFIQAACLVAVLAVSATIAHAQTSVDPTNLTDPHVTWLSDPSIELTYTGPSNCNLVFFTVPDCLFIPAQTPEPDGNGLYSCSVEGAPSYTNCYTIVNPFDDEFLGFALVFVTPGEMFGPTVTGGPVDLVVPSSATCTDNGKPCASPDIDLVPTPEPGTGILFLMGFLLLAFGVWKRRRNHSRLALATE